VTNQRRREVFFKGGPEPLEKEINEILGSKREDRLSDPLFLRVDLNPLKKKAMSSYVRNVMKWYQKHVKVRFSYLVWHDNFCKGPRTLRKFPQKCQKIARC